MMRIWPKYSQIVLGISAGIYLLGASSVRSCEDFRKPETHFDGVNEFGFVSYWNQLWELKLSDGSLLPIIAGFRSDWEAINSSPLIGNGWFIGIFDSRFIQNSENAFDLISIDGYTIPFGRDSKHPSILNGAQGWKAEIQGNTITAWAKCGWKFQFYKGRISEIVTPKNTLVKIRRDENGTVTEIIDGSKIVIKVQKDRSGMLSGLELGTERVEFHHAERPAIQSINGVRVVGETNFALGEVVLPGGTIWGYDYTPDSELFPAMTVSKNTREIRKITWDPVSKCILRDGRWKYDILPSKIAGLNAKISRVLDETNTLESWNFDAATGINTVVRADGSEVVTSRFTSGALVDKLRSKIVSKDGKVISGLRRIYDEKGKILREDRFRGGRWNADVYYAYEIPDDLDKWRDRAETILVSLTASGTSAKHIYKFGKLVSIHAVNADGVIKIRDQF